jgi:hypothetical protein
MPCPICGLTAPPRDDPTLSECNDCASNSLAIGTADVGVPPPPAVVNEIVFPWAILTALDPRASDAGIEELEAELLVLNLERRLFAEDLRAMGGRD